MKKLSKLTALIIVLSIVFSSFAYAGVATFGNPDNLLDISLFSKGEFCSVHFDPDFYANLTEDERTLYDAVSDTTLHHREIADISQCEYRDPDALRAFLECIFNTQLYNVPIEDKIGVKYQDGVISELIFTYENVKYYSDPSVNSIEDGIDLALEEVDESMDDLEILLILHDYLVREIDYDPAEPVADIDPDSFTVYGVFIKRIAVCLGYAQAYSMLLSRCGIESYVVVSDTMGHAWNIVKYDDNWYHVDTTWDDPTNYKGGFIYHKYFMRSDSEFVLPEFKHRDWYIENSPQTPSCNISAGFVGYCFRPYGNIEQQYYPGCQNYIDGLFYSLSDSFGSDVMFVSTIDGTVKYSVELSRRYQYMFTLNGKLYANSSNIVYELDTDGNELRIVACSDYPIENFWLRLGRLQFQFTDSSGVTQITTVDLSKPPENYFTQGDFSFIAKGENEMILESYTGNSQKITIPGEINGRVLTEISARAFFENDSLLEVVIPDSVKVIDDYAFCRCNNIYSINIPDNIEKIGNYAFFNINYVESYSFPDTLEEIGDCAFSYNYYLSDVYFYGAVPAEWGGYIFSSPEWAGQPLPTIHYEDGQSGWTSPEWTDRYNIKYSTVSFPATVKKVTVSGIIMSYIPEREVTISLMQNGALKYSGTITNLSAGIAPDGRVIQNFSITEVKSGTYDLVISKAGHLTYTVTDIVVDKNDIDLTKSEKPYSNIKLLAGDINSDGSINSTDWSVLWNDTNYMKPVSSALNILADINGDGKINSTDWSILWNDDNYFKGTINCTFEY